MTLRIKWKRKKRSFFPLFTFTWWPRVRETVFGPPFIKGPFAPLTSVNFELWLCTCNSLNSTQLSFAAANNKEKKKTQVSTSTATIFLQQEKQETSREQTLQDEDNEKFFRDICDCYVTCDSFTVAGSDFEWLVEKVAQEGVEKGPTGYPSSPWSSSPPSSRPSAWTLFALWRTPRWTWSPWTHRWSLWTVLRAFFHLSFFSFYSSLSLSLSRLLTYIFSWLYQQQPGHLSVAHFCYFLGHRQGHGQEKEAGRERDVWIITKETLLPLYAFVLTHKSLS